MTINSKDTTHIKILTNISKKDQSKFKTISDVISSVYITF